MKLLDDGNFSAWLRITLYVVGLAVFVIGLGFDWLPRWLRMAAFLLGFGMMALGGISSRARMLKIKPFDNSYKKARDSYKVKDDENNK